MGERGWTIVVPLKRIPHAKSRLRPATAGPAEHARLIEAIRADTIAVATAVGRVVLVYDEPVEAADLTGIEPIDELSAIVQVRPGLNEALSDAAKLVSARWPDDAIAALVGDLPALTVTELADALGSATDWPRAFVPDLAGTGTTLLTAAAGVELEPEFGDGSAARHALTAHRLSAGVGLRLDVDTQDDLVIAVRQGVGPHTRHALG